MKLISLLTLLCATSVNAGWYQCHCAGHRLAQQATNAACAKIPGGELIPFGNGHDCRVSNYPKAFERYCRLQNKKITGYCQWVMG
ncbi:hypothetical protein LX32DRAFT_646649 [Colletotrichum zoysiae]|uniref:Uncharacterized protein n=1 Tax=Colletotrichum zoysiae TaxID=1216348 RepID=A0AAD9H2H0_9PEZI|nr:hypothetical protein LX32DRAFT_646649 [Colletotrichum zoysiae]